MKRAGLQPLAGVVIALAAGLLLATVANAVGADGAAAGEMRELYESSGLRSQVASTAELVDHGLAQQQGQLDAETLAAARRRLLRAYDADSLEAALLAGLASRYDAAHAAGALAWLRSPLGQRIARVEADSATTEGAREMQKFALGLAKNPPSRQRQALAIRFAAASRAAESMLELTLATSLGIASALDASLPTERRAGPEEMRAEVEARRVWLEPMLRQVATVGFLFTYRELSDAEIETYLDFAESAAGRWYRDALTSSLLDSVTAASLEIGDARASDR